MPGCRDAMLWLGPAVARPSAMRERMANNIERTIIEPRGVTRPLGMYSHAIAVRPGRLLFIAGQVSVSEEGELVGDGEIGAQVRQVFHNLEQVLASSGATFQNVVQFTTYLVSAQDVQGYLHSRLDIYQRAFPNGDYPTNTLLVVHQLVRPEFLIEVEAIAALP